MRKAFSSCALLGLAGVVSFLQGERNAAACGGCFHEPPPPSAPPDSVDAVITAERMIFSISKDQTTLYDEINYSGTPSSFAWVLPIKGEVEVGLSADILFGTIDQMTAVTVQAPREGCPAPPSTCGYFGGGYSGGGCGFGSVGGGTTTGPSFAAEDAGLQDVDSGVTVLTQSQVGPYEMVQLQSSDGKALTRWLDANGYELPKKDEPVIAHYVAEGMDFLALKLIPGVGVKAMQPVRVTTRGASPVLPLRMVGVGTGPKTGITLWIVAEARWEPQNFPFFSIDSSELEWDWATSSSSYEALRQSKESASGNRAWLMESSLDLAQYFISQKLRSAVQQNVAGVGGYADPTPTPPPGGKKDAGGAHDGSTPIDAAVPDVGGGSETGSVDSGEAGVDDAGDAGSDAGDAGPLVADSGGVPGADGGAPLPDAASDQPAVPPTEAELAQQDLDVLFRGIVGSNVRITRLRTDIAHSALADDLVIGASSDPSEVSNVISPPKKQVGQPTCTVFNAGCGTLQLPRDKAIAYANDHYPSYGSNVGGADGGGCGCRTASGPLAWRTTLAMFGAVAGFGILRLGGRRRSRRGPR